VRRAVGLQGQLNLRHLRDGNPGTLRGLAQRQIRGTSHTANPGPDCHVQQRVVPRDKNAHVPALHPRPGQARP